MSQKEGKGFFGRESCQIDCEIFKNLGSSQTMSLNANAKRIAIGQPLHSSSDNEDVIDSDAIADPKSPSSLSLQVPLESSKRIALNGELRDDDDGREGLLVNGAPTNDCFNDLPHEIIQLIFSHLDEKHRLWYVKRWN